MYIFLQEGIEREGSFGFTGAKSKASFTCVTPRCWMETALGFLDACISGNSFWLEHLVCQKLNEGRRIVGRLFCQGRGTDHCGTLHGLIH